MVYRYKNFLTPTECDYFISLHAALYKPQITKEAFLFRNTEVVTFSSYPSFNTDLLTSRFDEIGKKINKQNFVHYFQIVKWPLGSSQDPHLDFAYHYFSSIIYLNDDFKGGQTFVENKTIKPKRGLMVGFEGNKLKHGVKKVIKGTRYTIPCWYKQDSL